MRCRIARRYINEQVDGTLDVERLSALKAHLEGCSGCRAFLADMERIAAETRSLEQVAPPDRVWLKIRAGLREQRAASRPAHVAAAARPRFSFGLASAAVAFLLVAAGLVVFQPWKQGPAPLDPERSALERRTLDKLGEAEWHYNQAIRALREALDAQEGSLDPEMARVFAANLQIVDASIDACLLAVKSDPRDMNARNALLASYKDKVQVLTVWISAQNQTAPQPQSAVTL